VAAILIASLIIVGLTWATFETHVSNADRTAAKRAVDKATGALASSPACVGRGTATCLVQVRAHGKCQAWTVAVRNGTVVGRPRWIATTAC
jgi:hypothetical protein